MDATTADRRLRRSSWPSSSPYPVVAGGRRHRPGHPATRRGRAGRPRPTPPVASPWPSAGARAAAPATAAGAGRRGRPTAHAEAEATEPAPEPASYRGRLGKARGLLSGYIGAVRARARIDAATWDDLEEALIRADVGVGATDALLDDLRARVKSGEITGPGRPGRRPQGRPGGHARDRGAPDCPRSGPTGRRRPRASRPAPSTSGSSSG